jgi:cytochrome oxidase Cu insertion factor (SCO1/SenC/PrrC family)
MHKSARKIEWLVFGSLALVIAGITLAYVLSQTERLRDRQVSLPLLYPVADFILTNQHGRAISLSDLRGGVWIADIVFTRCAGPCPKMTKRMSELQKALPANNPVKLITLTTDPEFDRPEVLKRYGESFGANFNRWIFLTGGKKQIAHLARDGLKLIAEETNPAERTSDNDLFIHSTLFVIVDKQGRLRGSFDYDDPLMKQKILAAVRKLLREK